MSLPRHSQHETAPNNPPQPFPTFGTILVNGGAVPITGGPATVANTSLIEMSGLGGNDTLSLDEANSALPQASLLGGNGNDVLSGGSGQNIIIQD